jgi:RNA polymerase sigma factor for flagellar operon FliA
MRQRLTTVINDLPERERLSMTLYYYEELSMKEIGLIIGVVESRISQLHLSDVLHLRALLSASRPTQTREGRTPTWSAAQRTGTRTAEISKS